MAPFQGSPAPAGIGEHRLLAVFLEHFRQTPGLGGLVGGGPPDAVFRLWVSRGDGGLGAVGLRRLSAEAVELSGWIKRAVEARGDVAGGGGA